MYIQVDADTTGAELFHLSILFQSLAGDRGYVVPKTSTSVGELTVELNIDTTDATAAIDKLAAHAAAKGVDVVEVPPVTVSLDEPVRAPADMTDAEHFQSCIDAGTVIITPPVTDTNLDVNGLPWDARIHAGSRERNTDGSWRVRRRPKGVEEADWDATLARVTADLTDLMSIPVSPSAVADAAAETAEAMADCFGGEPSDYSTQPLTDMEGGITEPVNALGEALDIIAAIAPPVTIAPPVVVPPVTAVAPPITVDKPAIETFAQLMSWLTSRTPKDEAAKPAMVTRVNEILAANGLTTLQQLGQRADLIPQVLVQFQAAFGE